jgi:hypothetical protein
LSTGCFLTCLPDRRPSTGGKDVLLCRDRWRPLPFNQWWSGFCCRTGMRQPYLRSTLCMFTTCFGFVRVAGTASPRWLTAHKILCIQGFIRNRSKLLLRQLHGKCRGLMHGGTYSRSRWARWWWFPEEGTGRLSELCTRSFYQTTPNIKVAE